MLVRRVENANLAVSRRGLSLSLARRPVAAGRCSGGSSGCKYDAFRGRAADLGHATLGTHCKTNKIGRVFPSCAYYECFPDRPGNARKPDVSFIREERLPAHWLKDLYFTIAPDLAIEVISPRDEAYKVDEKVQEYLDAGVRLVWEINAERRGVLVHRADGTVTKLKGTDNLSDEDVVPGFSCQVDDLFPLEPATNGHAQARIS